MFSSDLYKFDKVSVTYTLKIKEKKFFLFKDTELCPTSSFIDDEGLQNFILIPNLRLHTSYPSNSQFILILLSTNVDDK